jgi:hypothetical protein
VFAQHPSIVLHRFFKSGRLRGVSAKNALSFWELFLWGYTLKEKVGKKT